MEALQKEKYLTDSIKKNHRLYISALTLHDIYNHCTFEIIEELSIQFTILTEEVLPFTEIVSKLEIEKDEILEHRCKEKNRLGYSPFVLL